MSDFVAINERYVHRAGAPRTEAGRALLSAVRTIDQGAVIDAEIAYGIERYIAQIEDEMARMLEDGPRTTNPA